MAKQSWKDQMYQQIANQQVQQVIQQQRAQQLQNDFANWQKQQNDIAQLQASFNEWKSQQPVQEAPAQPVQTAPVETAQATQEIPSIKTAKPKRDLQAEAQEYFAKVRAQREQERTAAINDTLNTLNTDEFKDMAKKGKAQSIIEQKKQQKKAEAEVSEKQEKPKKPMLKPDNTADYSASYAAAQQAPDANKRGGKKWNESVTDTLNQLNSREQRALNNLTKLQNIDKTKQETEVNNAIEGVSEEAIKQYAEKRGISVEAARTEVEDNLKKAAAMKNASIETPGSQNDVSQRMTQDAQANSAEQKRLAAQRQYTPYESWELAMGKAVSDVVRGPVYLAGKALGQDWDLYSDRNKEEYAQSKEQNPKSSGFGTLTGMALVSHALGGGFGGRAMRTVGLPSAAEAFNATQGEALLNGASKSEAFLRALGVAGRQTIANAGRDILRTDLATDIIPTLANDIAEGKSTGEIVANTTLNTLLNGGFNAVGDIASLAKPVGNSLFDNAAKNVAEEAIKYTPDDTLKNVIPGIETEDDVIRSINDQFSEYMRMYQPETSAMKNIYSAEDLDNAMSRQLAEAMRTNQPTDVPVRPGTAAPVSPSIENAAEEISKAMDAEEAAKAIEPPKAIENAAKTQQTEVPKVLTDDEEAQLLYDFDNIDESYFGNRAAIRESLENKDFSMPDVTINEVPGKNGKMQYEIVDLATNRKIKTFASRKAAEKAQAEYVAGDVLKEKAIKAFDDIRAALQRYQKAAFESTDVEEVNTAKKAVEAARKRYERAMKELDPSYYDAVSSKDFGDRIARPYYTRNPAAENPVDEALVNDMVNEWVDRDINNPNRFVRNAEPDSTNVYRGVEDNNVPNNENDLWEQLKSGENNPVPNDRTQIPMNIQALGEEPSSRAEKILQEIRNGEDVPNGPQPKVSEFYNNSMQRNKYAWDAEDLNDLYTADRFEYLPTSEKTSVQNAFENVKANRDNLIDRYSRQADNITKPKEMKQFYNSQDIDQMHLLIRDLRRKEALAKDPAQKALFAQQRYDITKHLYDATHSGAAVMQAGQKWLNDADGILDTAESYRIKKANEIFENNPKLKQEADRVAEDIYNRFKELEKNNVLVDLSEEERKKRLREMIDEALSNSEVKRRLGQEDIEKIANNLLQTPSADRIKQGIEDALSNIGWIKDETVQEVYDIWSRIEDLDPGSKQFQKEVTKIYTLLANDIGGSGTFWDKVDSWRYLAMLANPTTHIRNILGNVTMNWMTGIKNNLAAGIEAVADRASKNGIQGGRTKAILTLKDGDLVKQSGKYFDNHAYGEFLQGGNRYMSASTGIDDAIPTFKTKALDKAAKGHSNILSAEDVNFGRAKYETSLAGFLKANGADASIFNATDAASRELLERAHRYALGAANEATFHTENAAANALSQFTKNLKESDNVFSKALGIMLDTTVPFKKTPMNILRACFEYSPLEFGKVIMDIGNWKRGKISTATMIDNLSKAITGTGGMAIGALLAHEGIIKVTNGTSKEQSYDKLTGQQALALSVFGHNIDISFLPPSVMPLIMGATLLNDYKEKYGDDYTALDVLASSLTDPELAANTALESLDTIVDTTMLSGINDLINTIRYAEEPQDVVKSLAAKTVTNYAGQMIPTLAKKTASVVDGQKYSSYSDKTGAAKTLDSSLKYLKTAIPGLQAAGKAMEGSSNKTIAKIGDAITAEPKINGWGDTEKKEDYGIGIGGRAIDQYLNPATTTKISEDRTTNEIKALSKRVNDDSVLDIGNISTSESKFSLNNKQYKLNEKQWTTYSRIEGHTAKDLADSYVRSEQWNNDTDQDRADTIKKMKAFSKAYAQSKVVGAEMSSSNKELAKIYEKDGAKGLMEEFHRQTVFSKYEVSKSDGANAVYQDLGEGGVEKYANFKKKLGDSSKSEDVEKLLNSSGMSKSDKAKYYSYLKPSATPGNNPYGYIPGVSYDPEKDESYQKAVKAIPSLKPEKYYETKDTIDADKNGTLKQDELINYINSKAKNDAEAQKMWAAYGGWTNKNGDIKKLVGSPGHYTSSY